MTRRPSAWTITAVMLAAGLVAGCGGGGADGGVRYGRGDRARFVIDGRSIDITESGTASVRVDGAPEVGHDGPVGCSGRYFTAQFTAGVPMYFRYGSEDAYLLVGSDLYYFGGAPAAHAGTLSWDTTANGHQIAIDVACPPPPPTGPLTSSAVPNACTVLTSSLARQAMAERPGRPQFVQENPDLNYCSYQSRDQSFRGHRRVSLSVATASELTQLVSWSQPPIAGLGDAAHGGDPSDGLAVRSGKLGLEITVDRGVGASDQSDLRAEESLARRLLVAIGHTARP